MFRIRNWKQAFGYMALGSVFTIVGLVFSPVTAQQRGNVGEIDCTRLRVVDSNGEVKAVMGVGVNGGLLQLFDKDNQAVVNLNPKGYGAIKCRALDVVDADGELRVLLWNVFSGGRIDVFGNDGTSKATLRVTKHGGHVIANGKDGRSSADLHVWEHGGRVDVFGNDGRSKAALRVSESGGRVDVFGNFGVSKEDLREAELMYGPPFTDAESHVKLNVTSTGGKVWVGRKGQGAAAIGVNVFGNGEVSTWDKNGDKRR